MNKWIKGWTIWCSDRDDMADELAGKIDSLLGLESYSKKCEVRDLINDSLCDCSMYRDGKGENETKFLYRVLFVLYIPLQVLLIPYCGIKWIIGKGWYLDNQSKISHLIRKIDKYS